jgi:hypothetical protein
VLTAAHCLYDPGGTQASPADLSIRAGISNTVAPLATDAEQDRGVSSFRVDNGYAWSHGAAADDIAVLTLAAPLELGGAAVEAVALPTPGAPLPRGAAAVAGFGRQSAGAPPDGSLRETAETIVTQGGCSGLAPAGAPSLCAASAAGTVCSGDSGSGLVTAARTLVGVASAGPADCTPGSEALFTYVGDAEILGFIEADVPAPPAAAPPPAPPSPAAQGIAISAAATLAAVRGSSLSVRTLLRAPAGLSAALRVCLASPAAVGGRVCRRLAPGRQGGTIPFSLGLRIKPSVRPGTARLAITAVSGAYRAQASTLLRITA